MHDPLTFAYERHGARLARELSRAFPSLCASEVEDALQAAWLDLHGKPWRDENLAGLIHRTAAWKLKRRCHQLRRRAPAEAAEPRCVPQPIVRLELARWDRHLSEVLTEHPECYRKPLLRALTDKAEGGETDGELARRHRLHRERVNRAWNELRRRYAA